MQFSLHRVWLLCRKQWAENKQLYILGVLATAGIMSAVLIFNLVDKRGISFTTQKLIIFTGLIVSGAVFTSTILSQFNEKVKGIQALVLPASTIEKLTAAIIYSLIVFPIIYLVVVYPLVMITHYIDTDILGRFNSPYAFDMDREFKDFVVIFILLQTVMLFGSVLFRRYIFIKTAILTIVIFFGLNIINPFILQQILDTKKGAPVKVTVKELIYSDDNKLINTQNVPQKITKGILYATPYQELTVAYNWHTKYFKGVAYSNSNVTVATNYSNLFYMLLYLSIPLLWVITWFRLKEKEL